MSQQPRATTVPEQCTEHAGSETVVEAIAGRTVREGPSQFAGRLVTHQRWGTVAERALLGPALPHPRRLPTGTPTSPTRSDPSDAA